MTPITTSFFTQLRDLVFKRSGIVLTSEQEYLVEARLGGMARELGFTTGDGLIRHAIESGDDGLQVKIVEAMATGETSWYRDIHPFDLLKDLMLPELISRKADQHSLSVWSAASSTGQELYSVAMMLDYFFPETNEWEVRLLGTDLCESAISRAKLGIFSTLEMNRGLPAMMLAQYFTRREASFQISEEIRKRTRFQTLNLVHDWLPPSKFDIILLRNVLIYFDTPTKRQVLEAIWSKLNDGGYLLLGSTETTIGIADHIVPVQSSGATYYQKRGN